MSIFDASALFNLASGLHGGQSCFCNLFQTPKIGSLNWAIIIIVSSTDGKEWMLRLRCHEITVLYCTIQSDLLASEAATLKFIKAHSAHIGMASSSYRACAYQHGGWFSRFHYSDHNLVICMHTCLIEAMLSAETSHQLHTYMNDKIASVANR